MEAGTSRGNTAAMRRRPLAFLASVGNFDVLPLELRFEIFNQMDFSDLGQLALTSEQMRIDIQGYVQTKDCLLRLKLLCNLHFTLDESSSQNQDPSLMLMDSYNNTLHPFRHYASLLKRLTMVLGTLDRINFAFKCFDKVLELCLAQDAPEDWKIFFEASCLSTMTNALIAGWDPSEYCHVFNVMDVKFRITPQLKDFYRAQNRDDVCVRTEMNLRLLLRCLLFDFAGSDYRHRASMIRTFMTHFVFGEIPTSKRSSREAMLLFLTFGPSCDEYVSHWDNPSSLSFAQKTVMQDLRTHADWSTLSQLAVYSFYEGRAAFYPLAQAICCMMNSHEEWKQHSMVNVIDDLILVPNNLWRRDNIAGFLLFCCEKMILYYLCAKLKEGSFIFVAGTMVDMMAIALKFGNELSPDRGIGKIFKVVCDLPEDLEGKKQIKEQFLISLQELTKTDLDMDDEMIEGYYRKIYSFIVCLSTREAYKEHQEKLMNQSNLASEE